MTRTPLTQDLATNDLADIVAAGGTKWATTAHNLRNADSLTLEVANIPLTTTTGADPDIIGAVSNDDEAVIAWADYTFHNVYGERSRRVAVLEVATGLRVGQYILDGAITPGDAATLARLAVAGLLPTEGDGWEW